MKIKHHAPDYVNNKDADVIKQGWGPDIPQQHWVKDVGNSVFPKYQDDPKHAFLAGNGSIRPQPHVKVNECDY